MKKKIRLVMYICAVLTALGCSMVKNEYWAVTASRRESPYAKWKYGPSASPEYFPVGVSTQDPALYGDFSAAGINLAMRLWAGPTEEQLAALKKFPGVRTFCHQNETGLAHIADPRA